MQSLINPLNNRLTLISLLALLAQRKGESVGKMWLGGHTYVLEVLPIYRYYSKTPPMLLCWYLKLHYILEHLNWMFINNGYVLERRRNFMWSYLSLLHESTIVDKICILLSFKTSIDSL